MSRKIEILNLEERKHLYDIWVEADFEKLPAALRTLKLENRKLCIVTETTVGPIYLESVSEIIRPLCKACVSFEFEAGENSKNLDTVEHLYDFLIKEKFDRNDFLIALGGGVTGDLTGFTAATYLRGISFIQIPTTLLSQVDSSIGGKTGVDFVSYKNMVGAFYQPGLVYIATSTLGTLQPREFLSGMGEVIKHGLIKNSNYYFWLGEHVAEVKNLLPDILEKMIVESIGVKKAVVESDPFEQGERALLNFGHTLGHAIEKLSDFSLLHGECVSIGMAAAAHISLQKGYIDYVLLADILKCLQAYDLPVTFENILIEDIIETTFLDKKMDSGTIKFVLLAKCGQAVIDRTVSTKDMETALDKIKTSNLG